MNRANRRLAEREKKKEARRLWPSGYLEMSESAATECGVGDGGRITVAGVRRRKDGTIDRSCAKGDETVWLVRIIADE